MFRPFVFAFLSSLVCACGTAGVTPEPGIYSGALALQSIASALTCGAAEHGQDIPCCDEHVLARLAIAAPDGPDPRANHQHAIRLGESIAWTETNDGMYFGCNTERFDRWSLLADGTTHLERLVNLKCAQPQRTLVCRYMGSLSTPQ